MENGIREPPRWVRPSKRTQARQPVVDVELEVWVLVVPELWPAPEVDVLDDEVEVPAVEVPEPELPLPELDVVDDPVEVCAVEDPAPDWPALVLPASVDVEVEVCEFEEPEPD